MGQSCLQINTTFHACFKIAIKTVQWVLCSTSLYFLELFHSVKAFYVSWESNLEKGNSYCKPLCTLWKCLISCSPCLQRRDMLSPLGTTTYGQRCGSVCSKLPPPNGLPSLTDPGELFDLPACAFQSVLLSALLRVEQT